MKLRFLAVALLLLGLLALAALSLAQPGFAFDDPVGAEPASTPGDAGQSCTQEDPAAADELARAGLAVDRVLSVQGVAPGNTNPTVFYFTPPQPAQPASLTLTYVYGLTTPRSSVGLRIVRNGRAVGTGQTTSDAAGKYVFYLRHPCVPIGYEWVLQGGDVVEVTAAGHTVSTTIVPLNVWMDPFSNTVAGTTAPGREVLVTAAQAQADRCSPLQVEKLATSAPDGSFTTDWNGRLDFDHSASSTVCSRDPSGNGACLYTEAFHIALVPTGYNAGFQGQVKPSAPYQVTRVRNGSALVVATLECIGDGHPY